MTTPPLKNTLRKHFIWNDVKQKTIDKLNDIPRIVDLKHDPEIILLTCNIVENQISKGNPHQLDKKELVCEILNTIFDFTPEDIEQIKTTILFLHDNAKIERLPRLKYVAGLVF
eukprot:gene35477-47701_t